MTTAFFVCMAPSIVLGALSIFNIIKDRRGK